jgi:uncharacterized membrane protein
MPSGVRVHGEHTGFLQYIDMGALQDLAESHQALLHVRVRPGDYVAPSSVLAVLVGPKAPDVKALQTVAAAFMIGRDRTEEQDPRFGLVILSEIAQRALSSAVNDPGTAVLVAGVLTRILIDGTRGHPGEASPEARHDRVTVVSVDQNALLRDVFEPIARDGAHMLEVALAVQRALALVANNTHGALSQAARQEAERAMDHAQQGLRLERERKSLAEWSLRPGA